MKFRMNSIKTDVRGTSGAVLLADWVDLDTLVAAQLREIARVLGPQGAPGRARHRPSTGLHPGNIEWFSLVFSSFSKISPGTLRTKDTSDFSELGGNQGI